MKKFIKHKGVVVPLNVSNIDTDSIFPKQFLTVVEKKGLGKYLFYNWRFLKNNSFFPNKKFILNKTKYKFGTILLTSNNFGCGSSREHAIWSLIDYGFRVIIANSFSSIFYRNSINNGLLLVKLDLFKINSLFKISFNNPGIQISVNLIKKKICIKNKKYKFKIDKFSFSCLVNNLDNISMTLLYLENIKKYEKNIPIFLK